MQSLRRLLHLRDMKLFLRWFLPVAVLLTALGCSKERLESDRFEFDAEWAEAYYYGTDGVSGVSCYQLDLAQGRTDADLDLISTGAVVRLLISAPLAEDIALPDGRYLGSDSREYAYTFNYGSMQADKSVAGSYVGLRTKGGQQTQLFPIDGGTVTVSLTGEDHYDVVVEVRTAGRPFRFAYSGTIRTFDCTQPKG